MDGEFHFGQHHELVEEVIRFGLSDHIPGAAKALDAPAGVVVIRHLNQLGSVVGAFTDDPSGHLLGPLDWNDFLEHRRASHTGLAERSQWDLWAMASEIEPVMSAVQMNIDRRLPAMSRSFRNLILALITDCAESRSVVGATSPFWEKVFECLESGFIPVSWSGHWPAGELVVYQPA